MGSPSKEKLVKILKIENVVKTTLSWTNEWKTISWNYKEYLYLYACFLACCRFKGIIINVVECWHWKMGNERKSNADISFLCFYIIDYFNGKMPSHVFSTSSIYNIKTRRNVVKKQSVRNVAQDYREE